MYVTNVYTSPEEQIKSCLKAFIDKERDNIEAEDYTPQERRVAFNELTNNLEQECLDCLKSKNISVNSDELEQYLSEHECLIRAKAVSAFFDDSLDLGRPSP